MQKGKLYKGIAIILFALIFIGAVAMGNSEILRALAEGDFNFGAFFYMVIFGFIACIPIYGIGEVLEEKSCGHCRTVSSESSAIEKETAFPDGWICRKCSIKNDSLSSFCKNCGEYK